MPNFDSQSNFRSAITAVATFMILGGATFAQIRIWRAQFCRCG